MNKEQMLLDALNRFGNFTSVTQEFSEEQLGVIYELMDMVEQRQQSEAVLIREQNPHYLYSVMGWLSAEKKPTDEHDVLICTTDNYIGIGWYYDDSKEWAFEVNKNTAIHSGIVAYWMEIPACPNII